MPMIQDIAPHVFSNAFTHDLPKMTDHVFIFRDNQLLADLKGEQLALPTFADVPFATEKAQYLFRIDETAYFEYEGEPVQATGAYEYVALGEIRAAQPQHEAFAVAAGETLHRWYANNRFCGRCGHPTQKSETERAMVCPQCGKIAYPLICPSVIVAVHDGDRLLLTKYARGNFKRYALIAGYAEFGEPIEDTVRREVMEEVGLKVKNLRFYKSQPWPYTDTLLMGFFCELDGDDKVTLQEDELGEGTWFRRDEMPEGGSRSSLTGEMIEVFRRKEFDFA